MRLYWQIYQKAKPTKSELDKSGAEKKSKTKRLGYPEFPDPLSRLDTKPDRESSTICKPKTQSQPEKIGKAKRKK